VQHAAERHRHRDLVTGRRVRRDDGFEVPADLHRGRALGAALDHRVTVLVDQVQGEVDALAGPLPRDVKEQGECAGGGARAGHRQATAGDEQLAVRYLSMICQHHRHPHKPHISPHRKICSMPLA
jgi:hypothetical protein